MDFGLLVKAIICLYIGLVVVSTIRVVYSVLRGTGDFDSLDKFSLPWSIPFLFVAFVVLMIRAEKEIKEVTKYSNNFSNINKTNSTMKQGDFVRIDRSKIADKDVLKRVKEADSAKVIKRGDEKSKVAVAFKEGGAVVVEVLELLNDWLPEVITEASEFWEELTSLFQRLPEKIIEGEKTYKLTEQRARGPEKDRVFYLHTEKGGSTSNIKASILMTGYEKTMFRAKQSLKAALKEHNYI